MKKGDIAKYREPLDEDERQERFILIEEPDGGRVLVKAVCNLPIPPTKIVRLDEIEQLAESERSD